MAATSSSLNSNHLQSQMTLRTSGGVGLRHQTIAEVVGEKAGMDGWICTTEAMGRDDRPRLSGRSGLAVGEPDRLAHIGPARRDEAIGLAREGGVAVGRHGSRAVSRDVVGRLRRRRRYGRRRPERTISDTPAP